MGGTRDMRVVGLREDRTGCEAGMGAWQGMGWKKDGGGGEKGGGGWETGIGEKEQRVGPRMINFF